MNKIHLILVIVFISTACEAQKETISVDFSSEDWKTLGAAEVKEWQSTMTTSVSQGVGIAYLEGLDFENGVIECDLYSPSERAFLGLAFRIGTLNNFECIYFQPHTSGNWDAVQYDPIFNGSPTWQLYHGKSYQAIADVPIKKWFHVTIKVVNDTAKVYLDNNRHPTLSVKLQHERTSGGVGVYSYHPAVFKNLKVIKQDTAFGAEKPSGHHAEDHTYISSWMISEPYDYDYTKDIHLIKENVSEWHYVNVGDNYLLNLNRYFTKTTTENTVLAKVIINFTKAQSKKLHVGYSDKIRISLNSKCLFEGDNTYKASDEYEDRGYVIDKHETLELPLRQGENELLMEIAEDKFGWGFIAQLSDLEGVEIIVL